MTDQEIRDRLIALETKAEHREKQLTTIEGDVKLLVADMNERKGREAVNARAHVEDREDRWQTWTWIRAFLPVGVLTGVWAAILEIMKRVANGE